MNLKDIQIINIQTHKEIIFPGINKMGKKYSLDKLLQSTSSWDVVNQFALDPKLF